jgi:hypothetical protein
MRGDQLGRLHDAVRGDRDAGPGARRRAAQLRRPVRRQAGRRRADRGRGGEQPAEPVRREAAQGGVPTRRAGLRLLAVQAAGQGRESLEKRT